MLGCLGLRFRGVGIPRLRLISNTTLLRISKTLELMSILFNRAGSKIYQSPVQKQVKFWQRDQGDRKLRLDYDLNENSLVFDLGGYEGQWASDIFAMYCCSIHIFEPVEEYFDNIARRFSRNKKIHVYRLGLASENTQWKISVAGPGSSIFRAGADSRNIQLVRAVDFFQEHHLSGIDLMKINIEGGEYDLLEHLIATGWVRRIKDIQVQFHDCVPAAEQRMLAIQSSLANTHSLTYQYPYVWENWKLHDHLLQIGPS